MSKPKKAKRGGKKQAETQSRGPFFKVSKLTTRRIGSDYTKIPDVLIDLPKKKVV